MILNCAISAWPLRRRHCSKGDSAVRCMSRTTLTENDVASVERVALEGGNTVQRCDPQRMAREYRSGHSEKEDMKQLWTSTGYAVFLPARHGRSSREFPTPADRGPSSFILRVRKRKGGNQVCVHCACKFDGQVVSQGQLRLGLRVGTFRARMQARLGGKSPGESFLGTDSSLTKYVGYSCSAVRMTFHERHRCVRNENPDFLSHVPGHPFRASSPECLGARDSPPRPQLRRQRILALPP
ncbi:hypothetical protein EDB85DRAFT_143619 [Lactarius pseudohatsudake]|nr:hypothetical protein EDB85DRAFT_143619 [Lactarius pseudohatsudake]